MEIFGTNFLDTYSINGHTIKYSDFIEIAQGGPEVGILSIDGKALVGKGVYFGGPPVFYKNHMFLPRLKKSFLARYFKLCVVDLNDRSIREIGGKEELILLSKVDDNLVYFFEDNPNAKLRSISWSGN
jgi:hypothetical protein